MAIAYRASSSGDVDGSSGIGGVTVTKPAGTLATDILILTVSALGAIGLGSIALTPAAGWTPISASMNVNDGANRSQLWGFWALGNVAALVFNASGLTLMNMGWECSAFSGADNATPIDATGATSSGNPPLASSSVTVVTANAIHAICATGLHKNALTAAAGFTVRQNGPPAAYCQAAVIYDPTALATGATGTAVVSIGVSDPTDVMLAMPFALRPAGAPPVVRRRCSSAWIR